jgi:hypothetical protein
MENSFLKFNIGILPGLERAQNVVQDGPAGYQGGNQGVQATCGDNLILQD